MFRKAVRPSSRTLNVLRQSKFPSPPRRCISTTPANKPRTWKGSALRWGLAVGAIYWYNTSPIFADEPAPRTVPAPAQFSDSDLLTVDAVIEEKRVRAEGKERATEAVVSSSPAPTAQTTPVAEPGSPEALEQEADQQGAFNPETGEINWDCPCLGGMATGPCGEEFKTAFSCFVYSKDEPKGMDCIEKFQGMQECFRKYPEVYGAELAEDETDENGEPVFDSPVEQQTSSEENQSAYERQPTPTGSQENTPPVEASKAEAIRSPATVTQESESQPTTGQIPAKGN